MERVNNAFKGSLAVIHNVPKDNVTTNADGTITVDRGDGYISKYNKDFTLNKVEMKVDESEKEMDRQISEEAYGSIRELKGDERKRAVADSEYQLASAYQEGLYDIQLSHDYDDGVPKTPTNEYKAEVERLNNVYGQWLATIHDVPEEKVTRNSKGEIEIARGDGLASVYKSDFTFKDVEDRK